MRLWHVGHGGASGSCTIGCDSMDTASTTSVCTACIALWGSIYPVARSAGCRPGLDRDLTESWIPQYNEERPHDSLGRVPPLTFMPRQTHSESTLSLCT